MKPARTPEAKATRSAPARVSARVSARIPALSTIALLTAALGLGCAPDHTPTAPAPLGLMAPAPAAEATAETPPATGDAIARVVARTTSEAITRGIEAITPMPSTAPPPADHPAYAMAGAAPAPNRHERALGIEPVAEPPADAPPLVVDLRSRRPGTTGSSEPTMDDKAPLPPGTGCAGGLRGLAGEFPWGRPDATGTWPGTGNPDPEPLRKIADEHMIALAGDLGADSTEREHALVSIGRRKVPGAIDVFRASLEPSQPRGVREMALSGLIEHGGREALPLMWRALERDPLSQIRGMAIWAVALYGPDEALRAILRGLSDPTYDVQGMAILAVWAIHDRPERALPILEAAAKADARLLWQEALNVLARMPHSDAGNLLAAIARDSEGEKRNAAVFYYRRWRTGFPELCQ